MILDRMNHKNAARDHRTRDSLASRCRKGGRNSLLTGMLLGMALAVPPAYAEPTLLDAWLAVESLPHASGYTFYRHQDDVADQAQQGRRLEAGLAIVAQQAAVEGSVWGEGVNGWRERMQDYLARPQQARTPARADITAMVARPRLAPPLASLASFGYCQPPAWVEVWHEGGVTRVSHRDGMTLQAALQRASGGRSNRLTDTAWLVSPQGTLKEIGIAAWNLREIEVIPGSRVILRLPLDTLDAAWIAEDLPRYLATRLPGDNCTLLSPSLPTNE